VGRRPSSARRAGAASRFLTGRVRPRAVIFAVSVTGHPITIAQGERTAVVGDITGGRRTVTVARWRDGAIAEEYVFLGGA
jgi:hypothetical protein